jgi:exopolysaccharide biosynthesis polyprenyl glycosylphosphotransferase
LSQLCEREFVQFKVLPSFFQILVSGLHLETISGVPILGVAELPLDRLGARVAKKALDLCGGLVGLVLSIPIITVFSILVYLEAPGPVFYHQIRMGRKGRHFKIYKIRSMRLDAEQNGPRWAEKNDPRRLKIGALMREWNLDELPQFWNVLKGDMSLVGPRPERPELIERFKHEIPYYNARHASKPGITGWAQVNGLRGNTSLTERIRYDLYYLENWSIWLDCQILFQTFLKRENAY